MSKKKRVVVDHDAEFRKQAGKLVIEEKVKVCQAAKDLGIPASTLHGWVRRFRNGTLILL